MIEWINRHLSEIVVGLLLLIALGIILNAVLTRRFFRLQFRKSIESLSLPALLDEMTRNLDKYRIITPAMMENLSDKQLLEAIYYSLVAEVAGKNLPVDEMIFKWSGPKRTVGILVVAQESFLMSGFDKTFLQTPSLAADAVSDAYREIGAKRSAKIVRKAAEIYRAAQGSVTPTLRLSLTSYDKALQWYHRIEKAPSLTADYIRRNKTYFTPA